MANLENGCVQALMVAGHSHEVGQVVSRNWTSDIHKCRTRPAELDDRVQQVLIV